jgi:GH25 family lysozyme M1 (1,4-beta-N-acetylmuramidase)
MLATRRRRRFTVLASALLTSSIWAAGAGAPVSGPPEVPVRAAVLTAIISGRPVGYPVGGIDLSSHDHTHYDVQWRVEVAAGSRFVYVKATEGVSYVNPHFDRDYDTVRASGAYVGAYVFARPDLGDPIGQAEHFLRHARFTRDAQTLVPFVDLEWPYPAVGTGPCYDLTPDRMRAWIGAFVGRIESRVGRPPMIYTNANWWDPCTARDTSFGGYPLDIASYSRGQPPRLPAGWKTFTLWQYLPGDPTKRGNHDRDVVNGGLADLSALAWPPPARR